MRLAEALRYPLSPVAFVGAGGKTSALFQLARELGSALVTTTTHLSIEQTQQADQHLAVTAEADLAALEANLPSGVSAVTGMAASDSRAPAPPPDLLERLALLAEARQIPLLIEADGAKMRSLKAPAAYEPVIPAFARTVVVVAGLSGLGKPLSAEFVHRPERFAALAGLEMGAPVTAEALARVLLHPEGGLKNIPAAARRIALLNQADTPELQAAGGRLAEGLCQGYSAALIASLRPTTDDRRPSTPVIGHRSSVVAVFEPVAAILLAAGASTRLGRTKQLLDWRGQPFVRHIAQEALAAGLSPVVVVTGAHAAEVELALAGLPVVVTRNADWEAGMSTSIRAGLNALAFSSPPILAGEPPTDEAWQARREWGDGRGAGWGAGAAIFLLSDQPQVSVPLLRALVERHAATLAPLVAPLAGGQRANPALFDRATFAELMALRGDVGGRGLFSKYRVEWLPWHDESLLLDVDTEGDWERIQRGESREQYPVISDQ